MERIHSPTDGSLILAPGIKFMPAIWEDGREAAARRLSVVLTLKHLEPPPGSCLRES